MFHFKHVMLMLQCVLVVI